MNTLTLFLIHGLLGGILWILVHWKFDKKSLTQHTIVSLISAYLYFHLYKRYNFPDTIMAVAVGYSSVDFIKNVIDKMLYAIRNNGWNNNR